MELRKLLTVSLIFMATLLIGCSNNKIDPLLIGDDNCNIPCWNSITPGLTTKMDAVKIIERMQDKENYSSTNSDIYFRHNSKRVHIRLSNTNEMVEMINFELANTTLGQLNGQFNQPEKLSIQFDSGGCTILIHYPDLGAYFLSQCKTNIKNSVNVSETTRIMQGFLTKPDLEEERLLVLLFGDESARMKNNIIPWGGYGSYPLQP